MSDWPIGLSTGCFYQKSLFECLDVIRAGGFCMIEVCSSPDHLHYHDKEAVKRADRQIRELDMEAYSLHAPFAKDIDITAPEAERRQHALDEILRAAEAAAILRVRYFVIHPGPEEVEQPSPAERLERLGHAARALNRVAARCKELGIGFALENMLPHLLFGNARDMLWLLGAVDTADIGICLDTGHAFLSGDIHNIISKFSGHLLMVHANDNRRERDEHLPPGEGHIDWNALGRRLSQAKFHGACVLELAGDDAPDTILQKARRARTFLRELSRRIQLGQLTATNTGGAAAK